MKSNWQLSLQASSSQAEKIFVSAQSKHKEINQQTLLCEKKLIKFCVKKDESTCNSMDKGQRHEQMQSCDSLQQIN